MCNLDVTSAKEHEDDGYISKYLIHWTGKDSDEQGAEVLSRIVTTHHLLLSRNRLFQEDLAHEIHTEMVCFTDVPLRHSKTHCSRYGRFGIAFHKCSLIGVGAQPVFYFTYTCQKDLMAIFDFLQAQQQERTIDERLFKSLLRHFYFMKDYAEPGHVDAEDANYYEREWRLGELTLVPSEERNHPLAFLEKEGYNLHYTGKLVREGNDVFFEFEEEDVAFLVVPQEWVKKVKRPRELTVLTWEELLAD